MRHLLIYLFLLISSSLWAEDLLVRHKAPETSKDQRTHYYVELLQLTLQASEDKYGPFRMLETELSMSQKRTVNALAQGRYIEVLWAMTSAERQQQLAPVRIPLVKGLLGHRVLLIREEERQRFEQISDLSQLSDLVAGQGKGWPDVDILEHNGLPVETGSSYEGLFKMLRYKRFDYFPRGLHEPWQEIHTHPEYHLAVESHLLLHYPAPVFFFVSPNNPELQQRLEYGLQQIIADGRFEQLLYSNPASVEVFANADLSQGKVLQLDNPLLSEATRALLGQSELWYQLGEEQAYLPVH